MRNRLLRRVRRSRPLFLNQQTRHRTKTRGRVFFIDGGKRASPHGRGGARTRDGEGKSATKPPSHPLRGSSPPGRAYNKFIVGEGSPLPKRHQSLCLIHGRRNASPTRQIFCAVICHRHERNFPRLSFPRGTGALGSFLKWGAWGGETFFSQRRFSPQGL